MFSPILYVVIRNHMETCFSHGYFIELFIKQIVRLDINHSESMVNSCMTSSSEKNVVKRSSVSLTGTTVKSDTTLKLSRLSNICRDTICIFLMKRVLQRFEEIDFQFFLDLNYSERMNVKKCSLLTI